MGTADADQTVRLVNKPVLAGTLVLQVEEQDGWITWTAVDDFVASHEDDRHYVLAAAAGTVQFGDGVHGRAPQIGERIRANSYRYGGGRAGNVPAGAISKLPGVPGIKGSNPLPARGGRDAESVAEALDRIPAELRRRDRAVTAGDFAELALATPGGEVGRAECLPRFHPKTRDQEAAGVVSVVVWPKEDRKRPTAPAPDRSLLRAVCEWLDRRRLVTTELYVIPPTYRKIDVSVGIRVKPGYGVEAVRNWVELVVRQYLAPLPPYGPDGSGWPLGRQVYGPELEAAALQVEGVELLEGLLVRDQERPPAEAGEERLVVLEPWEVPEVATVSVVAGDPLPPGQLPQATEPDRLPVPIPTLKEIC
jgi:predicted phage baseplate assembly protein